MQKKIVNSTKIKRTNKLSFVWVMVGVLFATTVFAQRVTTINPKGTKFTTGNVVTEGPASPTTPAPIAGDIWFDTSTNITKVYDAGATTWKEIDPDLVTTSSAAPTTPARGDIWRNNTDANDIQTSVWDGLTWQSIGSTVARALWDADKDTGVQVEETADDDIIRFDTAGSERMMINKTGNVLFANPGNFERTAMNPNPPTAVLGIDGTVSTHHGRLRLTAGSQDTFDDSQGASIDLHGNDATANTGILDLVAGQAASGSNAAIKFWTNSTGAIGGQAPRMAITGNGNVGIGNTNPNTNAILDLTNTNQGALLLPSETLPVNISAPTDGMLIHSSDNKNAYLRTDGAWKPIAYNTVANELIFDGSNDADTNNDNFYYVSMVINGDWKVIRYNKTDVNSETVATTTNNPGQTTQPTTLTICNGLTYN